MRQKGRKCLLMIQISTICFGLVHITQLRHFDFRSISTFANFHLYQEAKKMVQNFQHHEHEIFLECWLWSIYELTETESLLWRGACFRAPRRKSLFIDSKLPKNFISFKFQAKAWNEMNLIFRADFPLLYFLPTSEARWSKNCFLSKFSK